MRIAPLATALALVAASVALAAAPSDWSHWRGPLRNGVTPESSGWSGGDWPSSTGVWTAMVGEGSSAPLVLGGKVYTVGWQSEQDHVQCLEAATGKPVWKVAYPAPRYGRHAVGDQNFYAGASVTPELDPQTGYLYTLSADGDLQCWNTRKAGARVWGFNLNQKYGLTRRPQATMRRGTQRDYGFTASPLIHGEWVLVEVGSPAEGALMAFSRRTGERVWTSEAKHPSGHSGGLAPMTVEGVPCVAAFTMRGLLVVRLDRGNEGKTVAEYPWDTDFNANIPSLAAQGDSVVLTSAYNRQAVHRVRITLRGAEKVWEHRRFSIVCSPVIHKGSVYFASRGLVCLDWETGDVRWEGGRFGDAASVLATGDDRLVVWANDGDLGLADSAQLSPGAYRELAFKQGIGKSEAWPHVALAGGRLFCKDRAGNLWSAPVR